MEDFVPYGLPGFSLQAAFREVAAHYGLRARDLKHADGRRSEVFGLARDALCWKLIVQAGLSPQRTADMLKLRDKKSAREGAKRHAHRIEEHAAFLNRAQETDNAPDSV